MNIKIFLGFTMLCSILACHKDKPIPCVNNDPDCYSFEQSDSPMTPFYSRDGKQYMAPFFNPNNSDEFVYHFRDNDLKVFQLVKYNLQTMEKTILQEGDKIAKQPKWSRKGWIAYTRLKGYVEHIIVVKDNGDSLRQFSSDLANLDPEWDLDSENLYWTHSPFLGEIYYLFKKSIFGGETDTILKNDESFFGFTDYKSISNNNLLVSKTIFNNGNNLAILNLSASQFSFSELMDLNNPDFAGITGTSWSTNNSDIYMSFYVKGLYKMNSSSGTKKLLIPFCHSKRYETISTSADGKYLIGERIDSRQKLDGQKKTTGEIVEKSSIYLIDLQTLEETKIDLTP
ncbi:TolB-like translocation protein [Brumimicrobium mesophilum]|uniref:hypothetical protein n=1 Tax=Brumimicrobium mesophilum TaxID=392717 RepID=UPI00131E9BB6|nr:hypothetical protein [Brumimicrobium mesophilum]